MQVEKMTAKKLRDWVQKLERVLEAEKDPRNRGIYQKWLQDAKFEQQQRYERKEYYIKRLKR